jgi:hypothetical protein
MPEHIDPEACQVFEPEPPYHRWAINEDPGAPSAWQTSTGRPDYCLACGVVRYPLTRSAQDLAAGPCPKGDA